MIRFFLCLLAALCGMLSCCFAGGKDINVVLITVDSFRPDMLSCYGGGDDATPFLASLAKRGVVFDNAFSQCAWTSPSLVSTLTGFYPAIHGVVGRNNYADPALVTCVEVLKQHNYLVPGISHIHSVHNYQNLGFDRVVDTTPAKWLEGHAGEKFFLWHHFYTPHLPYNPEPEYMEKFFPWKWDELPRKLQQKLEIIRRDIIVRKGSFALCPQEMPAVKALYRATLRQVDDQIKQLWDILEQKGLLDKTLFIVTADHGEEMLERGFIGHASTNLSGTAFDEVLRIPLIMSLPGVLPEGKRVESLVGTIDIMPTVFDILGIVDPVKRSGHSLLGVIEDGTKGRAHIFCENRPGGYQVEDSDDKSWLYAVVTSRWKLILKRSEKGEESLELYDRKADPGETENVAAHYPAEQKRLKALLARWFVENTHTKQRLLGKSGQTHLEAATTVPVVTAPADGAVLDFDADNARIALSWTGSAGREYALEYEVGRGDYFMQGVLDISGNGRVFGPFPADLWQQFHLYNPWRFRVCDKTAPELKSEWREFGFEEKK